MIENKKFTERAQKPTSVGLIYTALGEEKPMSGLGNREVRPGVI